MGVLLTIAGALWLMLPAYLANMAATLVGGGRPIDGGRVWKDGRRVLGDGKTWRGLLLAPLLAAVVIAALRAARVTPALSWGSFSDYGPTPWFLVFAYAMGFGALVGDAVESFFKRRLGKDRGARWFPFDQLDFVVGAWVFGILAATLLAPALGYNWFLAEWTWPRLLWVFALTPALHLLVNWIAYKIGQKDVPW